MIHGYAHVGVRVSNLARSREFYELLGFQFVIGPIGPEPVAIMEHPAGIEINLVLNAPGDERAEHRPNALMDVPEKHPGFTHIALLCQDLDAFVQRLQAAGVRVSSGPVEFVTGARAYFIRDPDANVLELHSPAP